MTENQVMPKYGVEFLNDKGVKVGGLNDSGAVRKIHTAIGAGLTSRSYGTCMPAVTLSVVKAGISKYHAESVRAWLPLGESDEKRDIVSIACSDLVSKLEAHLELAERVWALDDKNESTITDANGVKLPETESSGARGRKAVTFSADDIFGA